MDVVENFIIVCYEKTFKERVRNICQFLWFSHAIIKLLAIGRPARKGFKSILCFENVEYMIIFCIVKNQVTAHVLNFHFFFVFYMENLPGLVRRESNPFLMGVP